MEIKPYGAVAEIVLHGILIRCVPATSIVNGREVSGANLNAGTGRVEHDVGRDCVGAARTSNRRVVWQRQIKPVTARFMGNHFGCP